MKTRDVLALSVGIALAAGFLAGRYVPPRGVVPADVINTNASGTAVTAALPAVRQDQGLPSLAPAPRNAGSAPARRAPAASAEMPPPPDLAGANRPDLVESMPAMREARRQELEKLAASMRANGLPAEQLQGVEESLRALSAPAEAASDEPPWPAQRTVDELRGELRASAVAAGIPDEDADALGQQILHIDSMTKQLETSVSDRPSLGFPAPH